MSRYQCPDCQYIYDENKGEPHEGFHPNTSRNDIPKDWACPDCAVRDKVDFIFLADSPSKETQLGVNSQLANSESGISDATPTGMAVLAAELVIPLNQENKNEGCAAKTEVLDQASTPQVVRKSSTRKKMRNK